MYIFFSFGNQNVFMIAGRPVRNATALVFKDQFVIASVETLTLFSSFDPFKIIVKQLYKRNTFIITYRLFCTKIMVIQNLGNNLAG